MSSTKLVASIYYNISSEISKVRRAPDVSKVFKEIPEVQYSRIPAYYIPRFNSVYQQIENSIYSYRDYAVAVCYELIKKPKISVSELISTKYIEQSFKQFTQQHLFEAEKITNSLIERGGHHALAELYLPIQDGTCPMISLVMLGNLPCIKVLKDLDICNKNKDSYNEETKKLITKLNFLKSILTIHEGPSNG